MLVTAETSPSRRGWIVAYDDNRDDLTKRVLLVDNRTECTADDSDGMYTMREDEEVRYA